MGSEILPSACNILADESIIPFYSTRNGNKNVHYKSRAVWHSKRLTLDESFSVTGAIAFELICLESVFI